MDILHFSGKSLKLTPPVVMGILNITPDSFFDGGTYQDIETQLKKVESMIREGASIIDIGAVSTKPGAKPVCEMTELDRLLPSLKAIRNHFPDCILSIDTHRSFVAQTAIENGADMINDIYGGRFDPLMSTVIGSLHVPCVLMHMKGTPETMQDAPQYSDVVSEVAYFFEQQIATFRKSHATQLILDPGFGFGKDVAHNYDLLDHLNVFNEFGYPLMVGFSHKSMINKVLNTNPSESLNGTTVLNTIALLKGASILRVHDVKEAMEAIKLVNALNKQ